MVFFVFLVVFRQSLSIKLCIMSRGGQVILINSVSREVLLDTMRKLEKYQNLVVRVSGFSAYFITLDRRVQEDNRTWGIMQKAIKKLGAKAGTEHFYVLYQYSLYSLFSTNLTNISLNSSFWS